MKTTRIKEEEELGRGEKKKKKPLPPLNSKHTDIFFPCAIASRPV
jgi:hypothetical protein